MEKFEKAVYDAMIDNRMQMLFELGMKADMVTQSVVKDDFNVSYVEIKTLSAEEFNKLVDNIKQEMERRNGNA